MATKPSLRKTGHLSTVTQYANQAAVVPTDCADWLPHRFHAWCLKMNLMPPHELPSVEELAKLCRGKARPALSYIIRHYQPRDRIAAFRASQAAKARAADEKAELAEKSRLEKCLREKNAEVKQWREEVERLESQLKKTNRQTKEWDRKKEAYEERTRLLTLKASEIHMRLKSNKLTSECLQSLGLTRTNAGAQNLTEEHKMAVIALLKAAGNDEKALKDPGHGASCAQLHDCLLHAQKQLLRKTEDLATKLDDSAETSPSVLEEELLRIEQEIANTEISNRVSDQRNGQLLEQQEDLEQACIDALVAGSPDKLIDVAPSPGDAQRFVEAVGRRAANAVWDAKLVALEAEETAEPRQVVPVGETMLQTRREMHALSASVYESLSELAATEAGIEECRVQALVALADSTLPNDVCRARELVDELVESIDTLPATDQSATEPTLQERVILAQQLFANDCKAQKYLSSLESVSLPVVKPLDMNVVAKVQAKEMEATTVLETRFAKVGEEIAGMATEVAAACEAAGHLEHPVRLLVPAEATVGGKHFSEWEELCKAAAEK